MKRAVACLSMVAVGLAACTGSTRTPATPVPVARQRQSPPPSPTRFPEIDLRADEANEPAKWTRVAFIPFGPRRDQLGFKSFPEGASQPSSFAVADDGTLWIADRWRWRLAHYSLAGRYLGNVPIDVDQSRIQDLVIAGRTIYVSTNYQYGHIRAVDPRMLVRPIDVKADGRSIVVEEIYGTPSGLAARLFGYTEDLLDPAVTEPRGPKGTFLIDGAGKPSPTSGIPLGAGRFADVEATGQSTFSVTFRAPGEAFVQPIAVRLWRPDAANPTPANAVFGEISPYGRGIVGMISVSSTRPRNDRDGGRWLLKLGDGPMLWERLPFPGIPDEPPQTRHVAVGPDGSIYLMLAEKGGELILRRPAG